jgi:hypothetical protein
LIIEISKKDYTDFTEVFGIFQKSLGGTNDTRRISTPNQGIFRYVGRPGGREVF